MANLFDSQPKVPGYLYTRFSTCHGTTYVLDSFGLHTFDRYRPELADDYIADMQKLMHDLGFERLHGL